jgi:arabinose-5-phosphate isomerase
MTKYPKGIERKEHASKAIGLIKTFNITQLEVKENASVIGFFFIYDLMKEGLV